METEFFSINIETENKLVRFVLCGCWTRQVLDDFHATRRSVEDRLGEQLKDYVCLSDISEHAVLSAELAEIERQSIAALAFKFKRYAFVVGSALKNLQVRRIVDQPHVKSFATEREALEWLLLA